MTTLIFGGINFVVILFIARYVYLRWFKAQILAAIDNKSQIQKDLNLELSTLENRIKEVSLDLVVQQAQAMVLLQKVQDWQAVRLEHLRLQNIQIKALQVGIDTRNQLKLQNLVLNLAQKKIITVALPQVKQELQDHFAGQSFASDFLAQACAKFGQS